MFDKLKYFFSEEFTAQLKIFVDHAKSFKKHVAFSLILSLSSSVLSLIPALITGLIIDRFLGANLPENAEQKVILLAAALFAAYALSETLRIIQNQVQLRFSCDLGHKLQKELIGHVLHLPLKFFTNIKNGELMSRFTNDIKQITGLVEQIILTPANALLRLSIILAYCFYLNPIISLAVLTVLGLLTFICMYLTQKTRPLQKEIQHENALIDGFLNEIFTGIRAVKSYTSEDRETLNHSKRHQSLNKKQISSNLQIQTIHSLWSFIQALCASMILGGGAILIIRGEMTLGELVIIQFFSAQLLTPVFNILSSISSTQAGLSCLERYYRILSLENENTNDSQIFQEKITKISLEGVSFSYDYKTKVLNDICLNLETGRTYALVGKSGCGKSTLADLLCGFHPVDSGEIRINNHDLKKIRKKDFLKRLAIVHQQSFVFDGTIRDNILYARPELSEKQLIKQSQKAQIYEFITSLELGFDSTVGENGIKLSGGQKQRLCLARAFASSADFIILDEATSHLDCLNEKLIHKAVMSNKENFITLIIAHNLKTIKNADEIIVMEQGRIIERGNHQQLIDKNGLYNQLINNN